jgi:hypothetical protein
LFSSDDPSFVAVASIFNSSNYHFWAFSMHRSLVGGTIPPITDSFDPTSSIVQSIVKGNKKGMKILHHFFYDSSPLINVVN